MPSFFGLICGCWISSLPAVVEPATYPRQELLHEVSTLKTQLGTGELVLLDARERSKYEAGHIPGALWVDHAAWAAAVGDGGDAQGWALRIGRLGIDGKKPVVIYDDTYSKDAARIWWILRYWGIPAPRLLNGGWVAWTAAAGPVQTEAPQVMPVSLTLRPQADRLATKQDLLRSLSAKSIQIVDARSEAEHCGTDALKNRRAGAIPGAKHLEWTDLLDRKTHLFKSPAELTQLFQAAGIDLARPTATHCQSGGRAAVMAYGLELMGAKSVRNYYKSWSEWGNAEDTPIVQPAKPSPAKAPTP